MPFLRAPFSHGIVIIRGQLSRDVMSHSSDPSIAAWGNPHQGANQNSEILSGGVSWEDWFSGYVGIIWITFGLYVFVIVYHFGSVSVIILAPNPTSEKAPVPNGVEHAFLWVLSATVARVVRLQASQKLSTKWTKSSFLCGGLCARSLRFVV